MKTKIPLIILILFLATGILSYKYLSLRNQQINLINKAKYNFTDHLSSSLIFANKIDINKNTKVSKDSILPLLNMYEHISDANIIAETFFNYDNHFALIDPTDMKEYQLTLSEILYKLSNNTVDDEDTVKMKLLMVDINLIYKYVNENDTFTMKKYITDLRPNLKIIKTSK